MHAIRCYQYCCTTWLQEVGPRSQGSPVPQVVGYMGVPYYNTDMTRHPQYITVRNDRGQDMLATVKDKLEIIPTMSKGSRQSFVMQTVVADDE